MRSGNLSLEQTEQSDAFDEVAYRAGRWFAAVIMDDEKARAYCEKTKGLTIQKAQGESLNSPGGFLVPAEIEKGIIAQRAVAGVFRQEADVRTMGSDVRSLPRRSSGMNMAFITEGSPAPETNMGFDDVSLTARKAGGLIKVSSELYEDEAVDLGKYFIEEAGNALAALEDDCGFNGDGTSTYNGMVGISKILLDGNHNAGKVLAQVGHNTVPEIDAGDLGLLMAALPEQFWQNAKWYASAYVIGTVFARLGMTAGGPIRTADGSVRQQYHFAGLPIVPTNRLSATINSVAADAAGLVMLGLGDLKQAAMLGVRRGLAIRKSDIPFFTNDQIAVRITQRFHVVNHSLGTNNSAGAFVGLVGQ